MVATASCLNAAVNVIHANNTNLNEPEKELLRWHQRFGHVGFKTVQFLMRSGVLSFTPSTRRLHTAASKIKKPPKCAACQYGKQHCRPVPGKTTTAVTDRAGMISTHQTRPDQRVFVDHFVYSTRGRKFKGYSIKSKSGKVTQSRESSYAGGCIFVDASSGKVHIELQSHLNAEETIGAIDAFESQARDDGIVIESYSMDNGSDFKSKAFRDHVSSVDQTTIFSGAGSHHQNGRAEVNIKTIMALARTMMLHALA